MAPTAKLACRGLVEAVTDYLENALPAAERARVEGHLAECPPCRTYLEQMRLTIRATGRLAEESISAEARARFLEVFRGIDAGRSDGRAARIPLGIGEACVASGDHIAYFWESDADFEAGVGFLDVGLRGQDHCLIFGHEQANRRVLHSLRQRGFDANKLMQERRLAIVGGDPSAENLMARVAEDFQRALAGGAPLLRLLGNLGWGLPDWPVENAILEFEAKVTEAAKQFPCVIVCMYDVQALAGRLILKGGFETHPLSVRHGALRENAHFVPTEAFLARLHGGRGTDKVQ
jgi:hypothetical protein